MALNLDGGGRPSRCRGSCRNVHGMHEPLSGAARPSVRRCYEIGHVRRRINNRGTRDAQIGSDVGAADLFQGISLWTEVILPFDGAGSGINPVGSVIFGYSKNGWLYNERLRIDRTVELSIEEFSEITAADIRWRECRLIWGLIYLTHPETGA